MSWIYLILGVWTFVSPWLFGYAASIAALWSNLIVGLILIVAAIYEMSSGKIR